MKVRTRIVFLISQQFLTSNELDLSQNIKIIFEGRLIFNTQVWSTAFPLITLYNSSYYQKKHDVTPYNFRI